MTSREAKRMERTIPPGFDRPASEGPPPRGPLHPTELPDDTRTWIWDVDLPMIAPYTWGEFSTLFSARDEILVDASQSGLIKWLSRASPDIANRLRAAWLRALGPDPANLVITPQSESERARFLLLGDPGEGDLSQWSLRRPMLARCRDEAAGPLDFAVIVSDVIYSAGQPEHYRDRFHGTLRELDVPVYAIPGNHDWDDGSLASFMHTFVERCDGNGTRVWPPPPDDSEDDVPEWIIPGEVRKELPNGPAGGRGVWHNSASRHQGAFRRLAGLREIREDRIGGRPYQHGQPAPYFAVEAAGALVVAIDQGFSTHAALDEGQSQWLIDLLQAEENRDRPVILLVGKPFASHGEMRNTHDLTVEGDKPKTLQELVGRCDNVVAVIGGDIHNYQHYRQPDGPDLVVAGGSGAYMAGTVGTAETLETHDDLEEDPVLYPTEDQSNWYLKEQLRKRLELAPVGIAIAALGAMVIASACSVWAAIFEPKWPRDMGIGLGTVAAAAILWVIWARLSASRARAVTGSLAFAASFAGIGITHMGVLAGVTSPERAQLAGLLALPAAVGLVGATFLPFGVLSSVFPLPSQRIGPALAGTVALTWLLATAYPALKGAAILTDSDLMGVAVVLVPTILVAAGYLATRLWSIRTGQVFKRPTLLQLVGVVVLALALLLLAGQVFWGWGARVNLGIASAAGFGVALAVLAVRPLALRPRRRAGDAPAGMPIVAVALIAAAVLAAWAGGMVDTRVTHDDLAVRLGVALLPALLLTITAGAIAFFVVRALGHLITSCPTFMSWLAKPRSAVDAWSVLETAEPPFFKSFLEVEVDRSAQTITVVAWGVSGFEQDADRPIEIDRFTLPWTRTSPAHAPVAEAAPAGT